MSNEMQKLLEQYKIDADEIADNGELEHRLIAALKIAIEGYQGLPAATLNSGDAILEQACNVKLKQILATLEGGAE